MTNIENTASAALWWRLWVDWTGQRLWEPATVDVSGDTLGIRWQWGRRGLPMPEFAPPAELQVTLRNDDHRYTPGNTAGPLAGNVRQGREVWLRAYRIRDDFATTGATGVDLSGRTAFGGASWEVTAVAGNGFIAADGEVMGGSAGWPPSDAVAVLDTCDPLATITARYRRTTDGLGGFVLRCVARDNCLRLKFNSDNTALERVAGRRATLLASGPALDGGAWYDLEIEQSGGAVRVTATRLGEGGAETREIVASTTIADAPDSGRHGLWHSFRNSLDRWGDFGVGRSLFRGRITEVRPDQNSGVCRITAADVMKRLEATPLHRALNGGLMRSGNVAETILGWADLSPHEYRLDHGRTLLTGGPRSVWNVSAARALRRLQREEHGIIYADGLGRVRLEAASVRSAIRTHADPASLARFSVGDSIDSAGAYTTGLRRDDGSDGVEDAVTFRYRRSSDAGRQRVWDLNETLEIPAGGEQLVLAATDTWDVIDGLATPVGGTDYTATDDAAGAGADVTADITVELLAEAASEVAGRGHAVRIRNGGADAAYLQTLQLYADHCWRTQSSSAVRAESPVSGATPGIARGRVIDCRYADNYAAAQGAAEARLAERSRSRPHIEVTLPLLHATNSRAITEGRLSDVVEVDAAARGITGAWLLEGMDVRVAGGGNGDARWWLTGV